MVILTKEVTIIKIDGANPRIVINKKICINLLVIELLLRMCSSSVEKESAANAVIGVAIVPKINSSKEIILILFKNFSCLMILKKGNTKQMTTHTQATADTTEGDAWPYQAISIEEAIRERQRIIHATFYQ